MEEGAAVVVHAVTVSPVCRTMNEDSNGPAVPKMATGPDRNHPCSNLTSVDGAEMAADNWATVAPDEAIAGHCLGSVLAVRTRSAVVEDGSVQKMVHNVAQAGLEMAEAGGKHNFRNCSAARAYACRPLKLPAEAGDSRLVDGMPVDRRGEEVRTDHYCHVPTFH